MRMPAAFTDQPVVRPTETTIKNPEDVVPQEQGEQTSVKFDTFRSDEPAQEMSEYRQAGSIIDTSWLPFAAQTYHISPNLDDYVVKNMPICPADLPNRNGVGFQLSELTRFQPPPVARQVYRAWTGCPVHYEHDNEDHTKALGVIFDTSLRLVKAYGNSKLYMVHGLVGVDKKKYPQHAARLLSGELNTGSMGALADEFTCSVCGKAVTKHAFMNCDHIGTTEQVNWRIVSHEGRDKIAFLWAHSLSPIEYSLVEDPAWAVCLSEGVLG
jgi:hypothetical protein